MEKRSFRSVPARLALLALAMLGAALLSLCLGAAAVSPREILSVLSGGGKGTTAASILLYVRLPRTLGCLLAGTNFGYTTAIGLLKSVIGVVMIWTANKVTTKLGEDGLF